MAYVKLDTGILRSTLWADRESREVFLTALLMALPHELVIPTPQIAVRTLDLTGWMVPAGWYGMIDAAGVGIVRQSLVDPEAGMAALERLSSPDIESRSHAFDGRRMARIDGGYVVLNFMTYRDRDHTASERMKRYRERKKGHAVTDNGDAVTLQGDAVTLRNVTQAVSSSSSSKQLNYTTTTTTTGVIVSRLSEKYRESVGPYLEKRARNLTALLYELEMLVGGGGEAAETWETLGHALYDMALCDAAITPRILRAFCRKLRESPAPAPTTTGAPETAREILQRMDEAERT